MSELQEFYTRVSIARESCAGCNVKPLNVVRFNVRRCIEYGTNRNIERRYLTQLTEALSLLNEATAYEHRLKPDEILCGILNDILHTPRKEYRGGGTH